jgi:RimJ/RimL family protein N-acetyltransferase
VTEPVPIRLVRLGTRHVGELDALLHDPDVMRFTPAPDPPQEGFAEGWVARYEAGREDGSCAGFAAYDPDGVFVGIALAPTINPAAQELELGYIVAPAERGKGRGQALLDELTRWALEEAEALRIVLRIDVDNVASLRVAERCGYLREGVLRSCYSKPGQRTDLVLLSLLATG